MAPEAGGGTDGDVRTSPLWGLVLVLGEIAERVERRRAEEQAPEPGDGDVRRPPGQQGDA